MPLGAIDLSFSAAAMVRVLAHVAAAAAGVGLAVLTLTVEVPMNPDGTPFGRAVERPVQLVLAGLVSISAVISWRWPSVAAVLIAFSGTLLGIFAAVEYPPPYAWLLTALLMVPAVLLWLSWQHRRRQHEITALAVVTALLLGTTWVGASAVYDRYFGPTHPESTTPAVSIDRVEWVWMGALQSRSIVVTARLAEDGSVASLVALSSEGDVHRTAAVPSGEHRIVRFALGGLTPDMAYRFHMDVDGHPDAGRGNGSFRTPGEGQYSFQFAVASCARTGSNGQVFDAIRSEHPLFYMELGDLHYGNIETGTIGPFLDAYDVVLTRPAQAALARDVPMAYVWDDHDYGSNDADARSKGRSAARAAYRLAVPHHDVEPADGAINQAFTVGRVRFVMTDGRSERTDTALLGERQRRWLINEIVSASESHALVVWANPTPWIGTAEPGADTWAGFAAERALIADALADAGVDNLVMVSGDAHMLAIDDGTNTDYSTGRRDGFPLLQAAPLDRPGNVKGGPYSEGTFPGSGQFGMVDIDDRGSALVVTLSGHTWDGRILVELTRTFPG